MHKANTLRLIVKPEKKGDLAITKTGTVRLICPDGYELPSNCITKVTLHANAQDVVTATVEFFVITEEAE